MLNAQFQLNSTIDIQTRRHTDKQSGLYKQQLHRQHLQEDRVGARPGSLYGLGQGPRCKYADRTVPTERVN